MGQGAVGVQCRGDDVKTTSLLAPLDHVSTHARIIAERAANAHLGGGCHLPIGAFAEIEGEQLRLRGLVGRPDGSEILFASAKGLVSEAEAVGHTLAGDLLGQGAKALLQEFANA